MGQIANSVKYEWSIPYAIVIITLSETGPRALSSIRLTDRCRCVKQIQSVENYICNHDRGKADIGIV